MGAVVNRELPCRFETLYDVLCSLCKQHSSGGVTSDPAGCLSLMPTGVLLLSVCSLPEYLTKEPALHTSGEEAILNGLLFSTVELPGRRRTRIWMPDFGFCPLARGVSTPGC